MPGGPANDVEWVQRSLDGIDRAGGPLLLPAATISVLVACPSMWIPEPVIGTALLAMAGLTMWRRQGR